VLTHLPSILQFSTIRYFLQQGLLHPAGHALAASAFLQAPLAPHPRFLQAILQPGDFLTLLHLLQILAPFLQHFVLPAIRPHFLQTTISPLAALSILQQPGDFFASPHFLQVLASSLQHCAPPATCPHFLQSLHMPHFAHAGAATLAAAFAEHPQVAQASAMLPVVITAIPNTIAITILLIPSPSFFDFPNLDLKNAHPETSSTGNVASWR
jgi:hypothetical protein